MPTLPSDIALLLSQQEPDWDDLNTALELTVRAMVKTCERHPDELAALFKDEKCHYVVSKKKRFERWLTEARKVAVNRQAHMLGLICEADKLLRDTSGNDLSSELESYLDQLD